MTTTNTTNTTTNKTYDINNTMDVNSFVTEYFKMNKRKQEVVLNTINKKVKENEDNLHIQKITEPIKNKLLQLLKYAMTSQEMLDSVENLIVSKYVKICTNARCTNLDLDIQMNFSSIPLNYSRRYVSHATDYNGSFAVEKHCNTCNGIHFGENDEPIDDVDDHDIKVPSRSLLTSSNIEQIFKTTGLVDTTLKEFEIFMHIVDSLGRF
jgi:hypothetical protein